ncbi:NhaP-type Na+/H+ or K+/H+ antiporter [Actinomadura meyerae]|uniref:NhaP-type Na+/H+ or K+/H+ antiporter n=1 Tax=Actinomadura meyerae TaxID=240840 RepID=A0A239NGL7_9ACTN|nr:hypothetical protein [Actinomadura meyerae]SNT54015.1 NhaP-type Na+/H+ or K+/H+ antiporter [Actinomadura meyerae]
MVRGPAARRFVVALAIIALGVSAGRAAGAGRVENLVNGQPYFLAVSALLAIGLYGSTHGIEHARMRADLRVVVLAVTVGVLVKATIITLVMVALFPGPEALVLGVAVAQIDPLSVAALQHSSRLSPRGKTLLLAWASFDDPVTTLLTVYAATLSVAAYDLDRTGELAALQSGGLGGFLLGVAANVAFAAVVCGAWWMLRKWRPGTVAGFAAGCGLLLAAGVVAVSQFWMLGVALVGLFVRPVLARAPEAFERRLGQLTQAALVLAVLGVGFLLSVRVLFAAGIVLGVTAFAAHALVSLPLTRGQDADDRAQLAVAQQNGITAIVLALLLTPLFPGVVATVAPAIVVINALHALANAGYARAGSWAAVRDRLVRPVPSRRTTRAGAPEVRAARMAPAPPGPGDEQPVHSSAPRADR